MKSEYFILLPEWYLLFFAKFRSHRSKNEKVMKENLSQLNAPFFMTELPKNGAIQSTSAFQIVTCLSIAHCKLAAVELFLMLP